jgi:hypothetical protein
LLAVRGGTPPSISLYAAILRARRKKQAAIVPNTPTMNNINTKIPQFNPFAISELDRPKHAAQAWADVEKTATAAPTATKQTAFRMARLIRSVVV